MGSMCSGGMSEEAKKNKEIERDMLRQREADRQKIKLLLLGAGESGKSTLFKQMKLLYSEEKDFTPAEREGYIPVVFANIASDMKIVIRASANGKHTPIKSKRAKGIAEEVMSWKKSPMIGPDEAKKLLALWRDPGFQQTWDDRGDIQVQDALEYYMNNIERIGSPNYLPLNEDILRTRVRTSGVVQENFKVDATRFEMYDVGGQRNERRKWIHSFDGVTSVIFVAAISEYNQVLYEDTSVNRQDEAVELFRQQLASPYFLRTPIILFLNKDDLFREKLPKIPFRVDGPAGIGRNMDFPGPHCVPGQQYSIDGTDAEFEACYHAACVYLQQLYESQSPQQRREGIYTKFTNSTDTKNIQHIMTACKDIILKGNLVMGGWLR